MAKKVTRRAAGKKKPSASSTRSKRAPKATKRTNTKRADPTIRTKSGNPKREPKLMKITADAATKRKLTAAVRSGRISTVKPPAEPPRPSPVDVPLGQKQTAFVRFDTPRSIELTTLVNDYMAIKAKGPDAAKFATFKWSVFHLVVAGLEAERGQKLVSDEEDPANTDVKGAIDTWAAARWPAEEDRPKLKALIFQLLARGLSLVGTTSEKKKPAAPKKKVARKKSPK